MKSTIKTAKEYQSGFKLFLTLMGFDKFGNMLWSDKAGSNNIILEQCDRCGGYDYGTVGGLCNICFND